MEIKSKEITIVPIDSVKPYHKNANHHPESQIDLICDLIKHNGFRDPLIVSTRVNEVICGNGRYLAAKKLGMAEIPVVFQDFKNETEEFQFMVAHNASQSHSKLDYKLIHLELPNLEPFDIDLLAIKNFQFEPIKEAPEEKKEKQEKKCPHCGEKI